MDKREIYFTREVQKQWGLDSEELCCLLGSVLSLAPASCFRLRQHGCINSKHHIQPGLCSEEKAYLS